MSDLPTSWLQIGFDEAVELISDRGFRIKQKDYLPAGKLPVVDQGEGLIGGYTNDLDAKVDSPAPVIVFGDHTRRFKFVKFPFSVGADGVKLFVPTALWDPVFVYLQLGTIDLENRGYGRHYQHLRKEFLALPPVNEQTRIVEKLEELLSDLDAGVAELKVAQKKLGQYRQSLLKSAVEGALTADWREVQRKHTTPRETGAQLLQRILTERRARWEAKQLAKFAEQGKTPPKDWQKKYPEPVQPDTSDLPELPEGWVWSSIGQCFHVAVGATPSRKESSYWGGSIPWVSSGEVRFSRITSTKEMISDEGLRNSSTQINPVGSVLLGMIGEGKTRGQVAILDIEAANNQNCAAIWVSEMGLPAEYVYYWLWSQYEQTRRGSSGNNQPALNKSIVEQIPFPLAPVAEMMEVVRIVGNTLDSVLEQETAIEHSLKQSAAQRQNILRAAFAGQLVPQDPNDEPASVLLQRIRTERAAQVAVKKPYRSKRKEIS
ncbi:MAG: restriction endonuclease subunit S [Nitrosomonas sp.]|uniref:restriction endonuclease subunit S n=1 Tax=Nitrosomonas sp. TaxID=42353 RepID=UPI002B37066D|nr:restriction endonuclease subunit S [Nitrosomonas sp.]MEB2331646.1 restriction endonuclease subunit S [Nitrosomonas sp.]